MVYVPRTGGTYRASIRPRSEKDRAQRTCSKDYVSLGAHLRHSGPDFFLLSSVGFVTGTDSRDSCVKVHVPFLNAPRSLVPSLVPRLDRALSTFPIRSSPRRVLEPRSSTLRLSRPRSTKARKADFPFRIETDSIVNRWRKRARETEKKATRGTMVGEGRKRERERETKREQTAKKKKDAYRDRIVGLASVCAGFPVSSASRITFPRS